MELLGTILGQFISLGFIALIIVFQQEVRRFLIVLGTNNILSKNTFTRQILALELANGQKHSVKHNGHS